MNDSVGGLILTIIFVMFLIIPAIGITVIMIIDFIRSLVRKEEDLPIVPRRINVGKLKVKPYLKNIRNIIHKDDGD